ncbi:hypothetical protein [Mycolicibacterium sp. A43C]
MTNPLRRTVESLQEEINATDDPRRKQSLRLALGSAMAAESKFFPARRRSRLRVVVDSAGLPFSSNSNARLTQAISDTTAMLGAYRADTAKLPTRMHSSYRDRYSLVAVGAVGNVIEFGFRDFGNEPDAPLFDVSDLETITEAAARDLVELLPLTGSDDAALDSVLSLPVTQRVGIGYLVEAVRNTALGVRLDMSDQHGELSTAQAAVLSDALTEQRTNTRRIHMEGILDGVRTRRRIFYLDGADSHPYQGSVDEPVLALLPRFMGQVVRVEMEETIVRQASGRAGRPTYRLKSIEGDNPLF